MSTRVGYLALLCVATLASVDAAAWQGDFDVGSEMEEFIPSEVKKFYESLNTDDRGVLKRVLSQAGAYGNLSEVLGDLRNGSTTLYDKAVGIVTDVRGTVAALSSPARTFVDETVAHVQRALGETLSFSKAKDEAKAAVTRYQALEQATKDELKASFPIVWTVVDNSVFQMLAAGILGIGDTSE